MNQTRPCGCKGCRTCLICEKEFSILSKNYNLKEDKKCYVYCFTCNKAWPGWNVEFSSSHAEHLGDPLDFPGVFIQENFLTNQEELNLANSLDSIAWDLSQSGRRKQNFGPKCNFKKKKISVGDFRGFPQSTKFVHDRFQSVGLLKGFQTIEQCTLEYNPLRGASIDPHIDDCWIWGERIVTVNLLADSVLTMTPNIAFRNRYNLDCVPTYGSVAKGDETAYCLQDLSESDVVVRIPMPRRSLLVLWGAARYDWLHQVLREDVAARRVCLAYREFTPPYLEGGKESGVGRDVLNVAKYTLPC